jgi:hypothetical protein
VLLAAGRDESHAPTRIVLRAHAAPRGALTEAWRADAAQRERDAETTGAAFEERQVEAVQVVILDHVGIGGGDARDEPANQIGFGGVAGAVRFEQLRCPIGKAHGDEKDPIAPGVEAGGLEIELKAAEAIEWQIAKVGAAGRDEILLFRRQHQHALLPKLAQVGELPAVTARRAMQDRRRKSAPVIGPHQIPQRAIATKLTPGDVSAEGR